MKDNILNLIKHNAAHAFYAWEKTTYGDDTPLSDEDRLMWMRGFIHAYDLEKAKREINRMMLEKNVGDTK